MTDDSYFFNQKVLNSAYLYCPGSVVISSLSESIELKNKTNSRKDGVAPRRGRGTYPCLWQNCDLRWPTHIKDILT